VSLVEALWRLGDLERELVKSLALHRQLTAKLLPPAPAALVLHPTDRDGALKLVELLGQRLVAAGASLGQIERELHGLLRVR